MPTPPDGKSRAASCNWLLRHKRRSVLEAKAEAAGFEQT